MELQGKIIAALPPKSGESKKTPGERWASQEFVVETHAQYPKKMCFEVFGADRLQRFGIKVGQEVNVSFDIDAREFDGRWFNSIRAFDVRQREYNPMAEQTAAPQTEAQPQGDVFAQMAQEQKGDDLPFG